MKVLNRIFCENYRKFSDFSFFNLEISVWGGWTEW